MGKSRDLIKKIGDAKGIFHARKGIIKDRKEEKQKARKKGKICPTECRVPENSKER